jgi:hypothetical protein
VPRQVTNTHLLFERLNSLASVALSLLKLSLCEQSAGTRVVDLGNCSDVFEFKKEMAGSIEMSVRVLKLANCEKQKP